MMSILNVFYNMNCDFEMKFELCNNGNIIKIHVLVFLPL